MMRRFPLSLLAALALCGAFRALAGPMTIPHTFQAGKTLPAPWLNDNFAAAKAAIDNVTSDQIVDGTVSTNDLAAGAVTAPKLGALAVGNAALADNAVSTRNYAAGSINVTAMAPNSVTATQIVDGTIRAADLDDGAVTRAKISTGATTAPTKAGVPAASTTYSQNTFGTGAETTLVTAAPITTRGGRVLVSPSLVFNLRTGNLGSDTFSTSCLFDFALKRTTGAGTTTVTHWAAVTGQQMLTVANGKVFDTPFSLPAPYFDVDLAGNGLTGDTYTYALTVTISNLSGGATSVCQLATSAAGYGGLFVVELS